MKQPLKLDSWLAGGCVLLSLSACLAHYASGRFALLIMVPPGLLVALVASLLAVLFVLWQLYRIVSKPRPLGIAVRLGLTVLVLVSAWLPWHQGNDLFRLGRTHHVKSLFDEALIAEVRQLAETRLQAAGSQDRIELSSADLPAKVGHSSWGFPRYSTAHREENGEVGLAFSWGGSLIGGHSLYLTRKTIPENGFPSYATDNDGQTVEIRTQTYIPWEPYGYIVLDRN